jgi:hypothetical protein
MVLTHPQKKQFLLVVLGVRVKLDWIGGGEEKPTSSSVCEGVSRNY